MPGFDNGTMYADNVDFTGSNNVQPQVLLDGQLLIGSTVAPHIRIKTLTAGAGVSIVNANGSITIGLTGGGGAVEHLTGDSGGQLNPDGSNNFNLLGTTNQVKTTGLGSTITFSLIGPYTPSTYTLNGVLFGNGTSSIGVTAQGAANTVLLGNGGVPTFGQVPNAALTNSSVTLNNGNNITVTGGTPLSLGGTASFNLTGTTAHAVQIGNAGGSLTSIAIGTTGQVLTGVTGADPVWASPATSGTVTSVSVVSANGFAGTVATATTTPAITLTTTITGVLSGNGTAITGSAITQYDVLVGGASNAISSVGPGTSGQIFQSAGNAANPAYSTSTYPTTNAINTILYASSANVMAALATANNGVLTTGTTGIPVITALSSNGQLIIGSGSGAPTAATLTAGTGITITNAANSITIAATAGGFTWTETSGAFNAAKENGYFITTTATATLPASPTEGDTIRFMVDTTNLLTITGNTGQKIRLGTQLSAAAGTCINTQRGDAIELVYMSTGTTWQAISANGGWNIT